MRHTLPYASPSEMLLLCHGNNSLDRSRRGFLKKTLAGSVLLSTSGLISACRRAVDPETPAPGFGLFTLGESQTLLSFCEAVLPGEISEAARKVPSRIDQEVSHWSPKSQAEVKSLLSLIESGTRYFFYSWHHCSDLSVGQRQRYLRGWEDSRLDFRREAYQALRMLTLFFYYSQDETWQSIGYDGPWVKSLVERPSSGP